MAAERKELDKGKDGTYYTPFPLLALVSDGRSTFVCAGGGGSGNTKEKPNLVHAQCYDEATGKLNTIAAANTGKSVVYHISYAAALDLWLASAKGCCKMMSLNAEQNTLAELCEFESETEGKEINRVQNFAKASPDGTVIVTGGSDGLLKLWKVNSAGQAPEFVQNIGSKYKELMDCDFSEDGKYLAITEGGGSCRLWEVNKNFDSDGLQMKRTWAALKKPKAIVIVKRVRFFTREDGATALLVGANVLKGPTVIGEFSLDGSLLREVVAGDESPLKYLVVDPSGLRFALGFASGAKAVYSTSMKKIAKTKEIHSLPVESLAFLGEGTVVSGSGDNSIHFLDIRGGASGGFGGLCYFFLFLLVILIVVAMVARIGVKGAMLGQGSVELDAGGAMPGQGSGEL